MEIFSKKYSHLFTHLSKGNSENNNIKVVEDDESQDTLEKCYKRVMWLIKFKTIECLIGQKSQDTHHPNVVSVAFRVKDKVT